LWSFTPIGWKLAVVRVTTVSPCTNAVAAIGASRLSPRVRHMQGRTAQGDRDNDRQHVPLEWRTHVLLEPSPQPRAKPWG
jgi:hypothetical protein